ncbi:amphi-Trp domain-containing protein [Halobium salinum]|uniref:Amphi-Trp domain-containing protein n=1 Tax=Halobium salinum TaxID=1364940 RepID=A0ABD5PEV0_9EURY|nr:amphi-Trp domain-containing protein [Halobium salinum]
MADKTYHEEKLTREEAAARLQALADELLKEGDVDVQAGNKRVRLHPKSSVGYEINVRERSSVLRGSRESVTIKLDWKP